MHIMNINILCALVTVILLPIIHAKTKHDSVVRQLNMPELPEHVHISRLISKLNVSIDEVVDATLDNMHTVVHLGNSCPFKRTVISKMLRNEKIKIMIAGGSVTYGADLRDRNRQRWPTLFSDILNNGWYSPGFEVVNLGSPACNIDYWVYRVREFSTADVVIVDLSVNDQGFDLQALPHLYHSFIQLLDDLPNHPAIYFHQAFRSGDKDKREIQGHCPAVNASISCCDGVSFCRKWYDMTDFVGITLKRLRVPSVSYRDLVWPTFFNPPNNLNLFWNGKSHPDYKAHQLMAKLIAYAFMIQVKDAHRSGHCSDGSVSANSDSRYVEQQHRDHSVMSLCPNPLTLMAAVADDKSSRSSFKVLTMLPSTNSNKSWKAVPLVTMESNGWKFFNDSKEKYGWLMICAKSEQPQLCSKGLSLQSDSSIPNACDHLTLSLEIDLTEHQPVVQIFFLKSYAAEMGTVKAWIDDNEDEAVLLNSHWDVEYSVTHTVTLSKTGLREMSTLLTGENYQLPSMMGGKHVLHLAPQAYRSDKFKWKLLGITSC
jgi:hypothetical protein